MLPISTSTTRMTHAEVEVSAETEPHQAYADGGYDDVDEDAQDMDPDAVELSFDDVDFGSDEPVADGEAYHAQAARA